MREIKFRAYSNISKKIIHNGDQPEPTWILHNCLYKPYSPDYILMQYTGLKDNDGEEIWEGDVVLDESGYPYAVVWSDGGFILDSNDILTQAWMSVCNVIGNIYENPELLEGV